MARLKLAFTDPNDLQDMTAPELEVFLDEQAGIQDQDPFISSEQFLLVYWDEGQNQKYLTFPNPAERYKFMQRNNHNISYPELRELASPLTLRQYINQILENPKLFRDYPGTIDDILSVGTDL